MFLIKDVFNKSEFNFTRHAKKESKMKPRGMLKLTPILLLYKNDKFLYSNSPGPYKTAHLNPLLTCLQTYTGIM